MLFPLLDDAGGVFRFLGFGYGKNENGEADPAEVGVRRGGGEVTLSSNIRSLRERLIAGWDS